MIVVNNPFGQEIVDFNEETSADRVGGRIRKMRRARNLSQSELGESVGLSADRIQKYENGVRRPKMDMMKKIADALGVDALALTDPVMSNYMGAMYAFFEMDISQSTCRLNRKKRCAKYKSKIVSNSCKSSF